MSSPFDAVARAGGVGLSTITPTGIQHVQLYDDALQRGKLKSVRWQPSASVFACAGNSRSVVVCDTRAASAASTVPTTHKTAINSVRW
jgi:hypothetical protein